MLQIDVYYYDRYFFRHRSQHIAAIVTCLDEPYKGHSFNINFPYEKKKEIFVNDEQNPLKVNPLDVYRPNKNNPEDPEEDMTEGNFCQYETLTIYADLDFITLQSDYYGNFQNKDFANIGTNCSNAVDFVLQKLDSEGLDLQNYNIFRMVCCPVFVLSEALCLSLSCIPSPPILNLNTPTEIYQKAQAIHNVQQNDPIYKSLYTGQNNSIQAERNVQSEKKPLLSR